MKNIKKDIGNVFFVSKYIYKAGKVVFGIVLLNILFDTIWAYIGTKMGLWVFGAHEVTSFWDIMLGVIVTYGMIMLLQLILKWLNTYTYSIAMIKVTEYIMTELIRKIFDVRQEDVETPGFYDKYSRAISEVNNRPGEILKLVRDMIGGSAQLIILSFVVSELNIKYALCFVLASLVCTLISVFINEFEYKKYEDTTKINRKLGYVNRVIYQPEYGRMLRCNIGYKSLLIDCFSQSSKELRGTIKKYHNRLYILKSLNEAVYILSFCVAPWIIAIMGLYNGTMTVGEITVIIGATAYLPDACNELFGAIVSIRKQSLYIDNLRNILEYKTEKMNAEEISPVIEGEEVLNAQNISFSYNHGKHLDVREVDFSIEKGEKVAFVGPNGAGKTTLACLLAGLYSTSEGFVYLEGKNIDKLSLASINEKIIMVNQDVNMISVSVAENILQRPLTTIRDYEKVEEALKRVGMYEKISALKNGLDTLVSKEFDDEGIVLSGGEIQKLAIARVYVSDAEIVIMDEPTSALDAISEREVMDLLFELLEERTIIIISHRLSVVTTVDTICYIEDGRIVEKGKHLELLEEKGQYYQLYKAQAERYHMA